VPVRPGSADDLLSVAEAAFAWTKPDRIAVAVSGGSDSLAALHLMARAAVKRGWVVHAVTVDHRLRPEAADEAAFVASVCAGIGVSHQTLIWDHGEVVGNVMDMARRARYRLIGDWARGLGIKYVVLGHTANDQAETFLMELARAAGLDGLSGMRDGWWEGGAFFTRPFLNTTREALRSFLRSEGCAWIEDPTNDDDSFARIKARRALVALQPLGITVETLARVADNLDMARSVVQAATTKAAAKVVEERAGGLRLDRAAFEGLQMEVQRQLLIACLGWVSGAAYAPRGRALDRVQMGIMLGKDATLSGCRIRVTETEVRIVREPHAVALVVCPPDRLWDGRWTVEGPAEPGLEVRALGADGLRACKDWRDTGVSRDALLVSPAIWRGEVLVAAPLAGFSGGWTARIDAGFTSFIISH
jgi:tRNA(Ile)-lysidine synthase